RDPMLCQFPIKDLFSQFQVDPVKRYLRLHSFRDVASNLAKADQATELVPDRRNDHTGPKLRAIFANAPTLVFESAFTPGDLEFHFRLARAYVLFRIENRKVLADDL